MGNKLKIILIVSISANLLLVGLVMGYLFRGWQRGRSEFRLPPRISQKMTPENIEKFEKAMRELHQENRKERKQIRTLQKEILETLTAPEFNAKVFQDKMEELHQLHGKMKDDLTQTVTALASQLNQEERQALALILEQGPLGKRGGKPPWGKRRHRDRNRFRGGPDSFMGTPPGPPPQ